MKQSTVTFDVKFQTFKAKKGDFLWLFEDFYKKPRKVLNLQDWTSELVPDFHSYHSLEAEAQLIKLLQEQEDREIMETLAKHFKK